MSKAIVLGAASAIAAVAMLGFGYAAGKPQAPQSATEQPILVAQADTPLGRPEIEQIVRDYLIANPEILRDMQSALDAKEKEEQRVAHLQVIEDAKADIFNAAYDGVVGNPVGKTTIVEFYDYNCGFCKRANTDMIALTAADPDLRFVLKEFPILGPDSQKAHTVSMAFRKLMPEKFGEFHNQLIDAKGRATEASAIKIAQSLGADEAALREEMKNPAITEEFARTYDLANKLSITGTPSYVIGTEVVYGALGTEVLTEKIAAARACTDATC
jgi:protein-disulfide isomerase